jgi:phage shock protein PspC (stress-responsive transcriptional regulator)/tetrahydromethanopterin S-methyltransferase subunit B
MEKIININFSGSAIAIDEQAHEKLKNYIASLNQHFSNEESKDEIINDIENRISELCANKLKQGASFISNNDVDEIMDLMGRPEDLEAEEEHISSINDKQNGKTYTATTSTTRGKLVRNGNDKLISGVASGIANYFNVDPSVIRLLFILLGINGIGVLAYIILWAVLPAEKNLPTNIYRRLYRNMESKMIAGVASGLATYFKIDIWIPRIVFLSPLILSMFFSNMWGHGIFNGHTFNVFGGSFYGGSIGSFILLAYIILWIVLPEAKTDIEKKALRGEALDINSIKDNVKQFGSKIETMGNNIGENVKNFATNPTTAQKSTYSSIGSILGLIIKGFVLFSLVMALLSFLIGGAATLPLRNFVLNGFQDQFLFYGTIIGLLILPLVAIILWIVRIFRKTKGSNSVVNTSIGLGITVGAICAGVLGAKIGNGLKYNNNPEAQVIKLSSGSKDTLFFETKTLPYAFQETWFDIEALNLINKDSMLIKNVDISFKHTNDSSARIEVLRYANGRTETMADNSAFKIDYNVALNGNTITCDEGIIITSEQKYKFQEVEIVVYVPVGRKIRFDEKMARVFTIQNNSRNSIREYRNGRRVRDYGNYFIKKDKTYYVNKDDQLKIVEDNNAPIKDEKVEARNNLSQRQLDRTQDSIEDLQRKLERKQEQDERDAEREKERLEREKERIERQKEAANDEAKNVELNNLNMPMVAILSGF